MRRHTTLTLCFAATYFLLLAGCAEKPQGTDSASNRIQSVEEILASPSDFVGRTITVRGYLETYGDLAIFPGIHASESGNIFDGTLIMHDSTPSGLMRHEGMHYERICTGMFVEVSGVAGPLPGRGFLGITTIYSIKLYGDENFVGDGELCYSSANPSIYNPVKLLRDDGVVHEQYLDIVREEKSDVVCVQYSMEDIDLTTPLPC